MHSWGLILCVSYLIEKEKVSLEIENFTTMNAQQTEKKTYETPTLIVVGSVTDITLGGGAAPGGDGSVASV
jgi:hypothetical protein